MFPKISDRQLYELSIGVGSFVFLFSFWKYMTTETYQFETDTQRGAPLDRSKTGREHAQLAGEADENHLAYRTEQPLRTRTRFI